MILAYKYKLKPSKSQQQTMGDWIAMLRCHYNFCLRDRIDSYEEVTAPRMGAYCDLHSLAERSPLTCSISKNSSLGEPFKSSGKKRNAYEMQSSELPGLKKARPWYRKIHSTVLQQNLRKLDRAFKNFFEGRGFPKFKTRQRFKSFSYSPYQVKLDGNKIYLPSIGWMRLFCSRNIPDGFSLRSVTVRQKADGWYVAIQIENKSVPQSQPLDLEKIKTVLGADCGVKKLLSLSSGETIPNPQFEKQRERIKTIRQRRASRKKRGSKNQKKAYQRLARIEQKVVNQRDDYHWKIAHKLTGLADVLVFEDLNIQGMIRRCKTKQDQLGRFTKNGQSAKRALNRLIRDCSWGNLKSKVQSVAEKFGCIYLEVNPMYSSQQCSHCGHVEKENRKGERMLCLVCGWLCDADVNAGVNLGMKGLEILGISPSKLLRVPEKVTTKPEATGSRNREKSNSLEFEPSNPRQLIPLFEWGEFQVTATQNP